MSTTTASQPVVRSTRSKTPSLIGTRIRLEEYDLKPGIRSVFPREGHIERQLEALNGVKDWYLLRLDEPFEYGGIQHARVLIRTRRVDTRLGDEDPTSAFVLLIRDPAALEEHPFSVKKFDHVGNAMAITLFANRLVAQADKEGERNQKCKHCGKTVGSSLTHCTSCGERLRFSFRPELVMAAQIGVALIILILLAAMVVKTDPSVPYAVKHSSMWYKAPVGILAAIGLWFVIGLLMDRFSKRS